MYEQLQIQKQSYFKAPTSPTNHNKLQQYFESSSFLCQQDQLSIFIRDFPIINLKEVKSINGLIALLIKQNDLLGAKCQQQINLLKQQYQKYDKMLKLNKEIKNQKQKLQKQKKELFDSYNTLKFETQKQNLKKEQLQSQERKTEAELIKANSLLQQTTANLSTLQQIINLFASQDYKKCEEVLKIQNQLPNHTKIQQYCQIQRKRSRYLTKIKGIVQQFCLRLEKIVKVVSPSVLAVQLSTESRAMIELISQICQQKGRKKKKTSERNITSQSDFGLSLHKGNASFFQNLLQKLIQSSSNTTATKEAIAFELEQVKNNLAKSKCQHQTTIKNIQSQFRQKEEESLKKLYLKQETIKYYEEEIQKSRQTNKRIKQQLELSISSLNQLRREVEEKNSILNALESRINDLNKDQKEELQRVKSECESRVQELKKTAAMKIDQRQEIINEYAERRKSEQSQYENKISQMKIKIKNLQDELEQKQGIVKINNKNFLALESEHLKKQVLFKELFGTVEKNKVDLVELQQKLKRKGKQVQDFKETLNSLNHEKSLQTAYISELEAKIQSLNSKMKNLESKAKNEMANKKEMTQMKNAIVEQKQRNEQYQSYCGQVKEENHRLKGIIKEMKKELEQVYIKLNELKQIQGERERLYTEAQNSDRIKQSLSKKNEELKFQMLKLETENKKIHLELKHFKNIVSRIRFNEEES